MNKEDFIKRYGRKKSSWFDRWVLRLFGYDHDSKIHELRPKVALAYNEFILAKGELFEDEIVPMDESELSDIGRRKRRVLSIIIYIALIMTVMFGVLAFLTGGPDADEIWTTAGEALLFVFVVIGCYYLTKKNYDQVLRSKSKRIVKGVITDIIQTEDHGPAFEISFKEMIIVFTKEYRNCLPGDIVSIVIYSERESWMKRHIKKVGNLFDHP